MDSEYFIFVAVLIGSVGFSLGMVVAGSSLFWLFGIVPAVLFWLGPTVYDFICGLFLWGPYKLRKK